MPQLVTVEELSLLLDETITVERYNALYVTAHRIVQSYTHMDINDVTGRAADIVAGVLTSVMARIVSNPKGARTLSAGSAAVTFGGADAEITRTFTLNEDEREALDAAARIDAPAAIGSGAFTIRPGRLTR